MTAGEDRDERLVRTINRTPTNIFISNFMCKCVHLLFCTDCYVKFMVRYLITKQLMPLGSSSCSCIPMHVIDWQWEVYLEFDQFHNLNYSKYLELANSSQNSIVNSNLIKSWSPIGRVGPQWTIEIYHLPILRIFASSESTMLSKNIRPFLIYLSLDTEY